ncbi:hypothetical protein JQM97_03325 [Prevotella hominis]|uniref:hypothetical protein n=1 Tax=Segatella hominis TaxID=2518605 RepID=UPI001F2690AF|nr:hypothetical protein [Segatella hominis]MCF2589989.1 hypothetical protein [Segatella hominis]
MESKTYVFGNEGSGQGGMMSLIAPLLQQRGLDPNLLVAMNRCGGFGSNEGSWFIWLLFILCFCGWGGNGFGFGNNGRGGLANEINNDYGRGLLMDAIGGNRNALSNLATQLNCTEGQIQSAISALTSQVQNVGNQVGMSGMQTINALQQGNMQIAQQIANCCCQTNNNITTQGYENKLAICHQTHAINDNANANALMLRDTNQSNHLALMGKLDQMQTQAMQDKLDALREKNSALVAQISNEHQTQALQAYQAQIITPVNAALAALQAEVAGIKCKLPNTVSVPYPQLKTYNPEVFQAAAMGAYAGDVAANAASTVGCGC